MEPHAEARLHQRRPQEVRVPDLLWKDRSLPEGARYLWCYLWMLRRTRTRFTFAELRAGTRLSQNSLLKYLNLLGQRFWLRYARSGRSVQVTALWPTSCRCLMLTDDLLLERDLPYGARWVWGVIRRLGRRFTYDELLKLTGYSQNSLIKYIRTLQQKGFLVGTACRVARRKAFDLTTDNPVEKRRQQHLAVFEKGRSIIEQWKAYSAGQFFLARMAELITDSVVFENVAASCLDNYRTGGRMAYDVVLSKYNVALEFQGPQHFRLTERFPDEAQLRAQQERDQLKRHLSLEAGIKLIEVFAQDLSFERIMELLQAAGVPTRPIPDEKRYVYQALVRLSERYRAAALGDTAV